MVPQAQLFGAQNGEHRSCVGGADDRAGEKASQRLKSQYKMAEEGGKQSSHRHPQGGQHHRLSRRRSGGFPAGAEAAVKHNEDQSHRADLLRRPEIVEGDTQQPVGAEQHPQGHKEQQRRHSGPLGEAAGQNTGHQHRPA